MSFGSMATLRATARIRSAIAAARSPAGNDDVPRTSNSTSPSTTTGAVAIAASGGVTAAVSSSCARERTGISANAAMITIVRSSTIVPTPVGVDVSIAAIMTRNRVYAGIAAVSILAAFISWWSWQRTAFAPPPAPVFAGSAACASCHAAQARAWTGSQHALAMQPATEPPCSAASTARIFTHGGVTSTFSRRDGKFFVRTDGPDGKLADFEVKYTFGVYPLQQYLVPFPDGRLQALGIAWDTRPARDGGQRWFHLYPDATPPQAGDPLHWTGIDQNWNYQCADCHSTNLRKNYDAATAPLRHHLVGDRRRLRGLPRTRRRTTSPGRRTKATGAAIGPGQGPGRDARRAPRRHLDARRRRRHGDPLDARGAPAGRSTPAPAATRGAGSSPTTPRPAAPASTRSAPRCWRPGLYHPDGQQRDEVYTWGSFLQSKMYAAGVTCGDCHEPHTEKLRAPGNAVCAQCHAPASVRHAGPSSPCDGLGRGASASPATCRPRPTWGSTRATTTRCASRGPTARRDSARPTPARAATPTESPRWAAAAIGRWYPQRKPGFQTFAEAFAAARPRRARRGARRSPRHRRRDAAGDRARQRHRADAAIPRSEDAGGVPAGLRDADPTVRAPRERPRARGHGSHAAARLPAAAAHRSRAARAHGRRPHARRESGAGSSPGSRHVSPRLSPSGRRRRDSTRTAPRRRRTWHAVYGTAIAGTRRSRPTRRRSRSIRPTCRRR